MITIKLATKTKPSICTHADFEGFPDAKDYLRTINFRNCYVIIKNTDTHNESRKITEEREAIRVLKAFCE